MDPEMLRYRPRLPERRAILTDILLWCGIVVVVAIIVTALQLPQRMECTGMGKYGHCKHSLLSPELWRRP